MKSLLIAALLAAPLVAAPAQAADLSVLQRFAVEPSVRELQHAAATVASVQPERVRGWLRRANTAALLPTVHTRIGRGLGELTRDASDRLMMTTTDSWRFEVEATWALDRLVFDRNELRASREGQRLATHREELLLRVAEMYYARRRLQVDAVLNPDAAGALDRALEIEELTAVLDGLTGGALTRRGHP